MIIYRFVEIEKERGGGFVGAANNREEGEVDQGRRVLSFIRERIVKGAYHAISLSWRITFFQDTNIHVILQSLNYA